MKLRPLYDRVLIKRMEEEEKVIGGIVIPDTAREKSMKGEVVEIGKGIRRDDGTLQALEVIRGDRIIFDKYAGTEVKIDDKEYLIMKEKDIVCIMKE